MKILFAFISGLLFSSGLWLSEMVNPARVLGFLDIFSLKQEWDPALLFVMLGSLAIAIPGYYLLSKKTHTLTNEKLLLPNNKTIDKPLLIGSIIFGIGWGLSGLCPGPILAILPIAFSQLFVFMLSLACGLFLAAKVQNYIKK